MSERVKIADIADELGLSTATVSNVIHGKAGKASAETARRVQALLEERQYIPSMAALLLAQNDSKIIGLVINDHAKYEGHTLEDNFISASLNALLPEIEHAGKFLMLKLAKTLDDVPKFASMWNMEGMVLIGFCEQDYRALREKMRIPFVVYDGFMDGAVRLANIGLDHFGGGALAGRYLREKGHERALFIADNDTHMDRQRFLGLKSELPRSELLLVPMESGARREFYMERLDTLRQYTALFAASDYYAMELIRFLNSAGLNVPGDMSVIGFDNVRESACFSPPLTTIAQDYAARAAYALNLLSALKDGRSAGEDIVLPVRLVARESARALR